MVGFESEPASLYGQAGPSLFFFVLEMRQSKSAAAAAAAAKSLQSFPTLCDPIDSSPPGSPVPGILQARTLEWFAISSAMHGSEK